MPACVVMDGCYTSFMLMTPKDDIPAAGAKTSTLPFTLVYIVTNSVR